MTQDKVTARDISLPQLRCFSLSVFNIPCGNLKRWDWPLCLLVLFNWNDLCPLPPTSLQSPGTAINTHSEPAAVVRVRAACPECRAVSQVDFKFTHMLICSNAVTSSQLSVRQQELKAAKRTQTAASSERRFSSCVRSGNCHCSWSAAKCFCSCCSPLKILGALMTAERISQAFPFSCQQELKIA